MECDGLKLEQLLNKRCVSEREMKFIDSCEKEEICKIKFVQYTYSPTGSGRKMERYPVYEVCYNNKIYSIGVYKEWWL